MNDITNTDDTIIDPSVAAIVAAVFGGTPSVPAVDIVQRLSDATPYGLADATLLRDAISSINLLRDVKQEQEAEIAKLRRDHTAVVHSRDEQIHKTIAVREALDKAEVRLMTALTLARTLIDDNDIDHDDKTVTALIDLGMDPFTYSATCEVSMSFTVTLRIDDVPHSIDLRDINRKIEGQLSEMISVDGDSFYVHIGDESIEVGVDVNYPELEDCVDMEQE